MADPIVAAKGASSYDHSAALWDYIEESENIEHAKTLQAEVPISAHTMITTDAHNASSQRGSFP